jgi:hypothetical protein
MQVAPSTSAAVTGNSHDNSKSSSYEGAVSFLKLIS